MLTLLFAAALGTISYKHQATTRHRNGKSSAQHPEDKQTVSLENTLRKKIAELEEDVQVANDDSTAWMERYYEQEAKTRRQSHEIERTSTTLGSRLTYLDLNAQVQSLKIKCNDLRTELRDSDHDIAMKKKCEKQRQGKDRLMISNLQKRVRELLRLGSQHVPTKLQAAELEREKAKSANLRHIIAQKDQELRGATDKISRVEKESADNQVLFNKANDDLKEKLVRKGHELSKVLEIAAKEKTNSKVVVTNLNQRLSEKSAQIGHITTESRDKSKEIERLMQEVSKLETHGNNLNTSLGEAQTERQKSEANSKSLEQKLKDLEIVHQKCSQHRTPETMAPTPTDLAPAASEGMDVDCPLQLHVESQTQQLNNQQRKIQNLEESNRVLHQSLQSFVNKNEDHEMSDVSSTTGWREQSEIEAQGRELRELREEIDQLRRGDHDMSDAFAIDSQEQTQDRLREVTESHNLTINMLNGQLAALQKENKRLEAIANQNSSLESVGRGLLDDKITRLGKEKEVMNTDLQKARKLSETLKKERDQLKEVKTKITYEKAELVKNQQANLGELEKLRVEKATLDEKCASLQKMVEDLNQAPEEGENPEELDISGQLPQVQQPGPPDTTMLNGRNLVPTSAIGVPLTSSSSPIKETIEKPPHNRKRKAPDDEEEEGKEKRVKNH